MDQEGLPLPQDDVYVGYGDGADLPDPDEVIARFHKWLHAMANVYWGVDSQEHEDLVQEGRIAMWRAMGTYQPEKGALVAWITTAAKLRMKDVAVRHGFFGQVQSRGVPVKERRFDTQPLDEKIEDGRLGLYEADPRGEALIDEALWAYHRGEIIKALDVLSPMQRRYVIARFWFGVSGPQMTRVMGMKNHAVYWNKKETGARARLLKQLSHFEEIA